MDDGTISPADLADLAVEIAIERRGIRETSPNSGPEIDKWLERVGQAPGNSWCVAFAWCCFDDAASRLGTRNPVPRTAGSLRLWGLASRWRAHGPRRGQIYVVQHNEHQGHVGIIESVSPELVVTEISGNTNADGSREGNCVFRHQFAYDAEKVHGGRLLGYLDFSIEPTALSAAA